MTDPRAILGPMADSLEARTGKSVEAWLEIVRGLGLEKHAEIVAALKDGHGLTYGYANSLALVFRGYGTTPEDELLEGLFNPPREGLRPIYERLAAICTSLGEDVTVAPKKTMVGFRRGKQFACFTPQSAKRAEVGIALRDAAPEDGRIRATPGGMTSHAIRVETPEELDADVEAWIRTAYERS
jgi:predicted transport protein